jgi:hypothetical protein
MPGRSSAARPCSPGSSIGHRHDRDRGKTMDPPIILKGSQGLDDQA